MAKEQSLGILSTAIKKATSVGTLVVDGNRMILDFKLITELLKYVEQCLNASFRELAASVRGRYD